MEFDRQIFWDALTSPAFAAGAGLTIGLAAAAQAAASILGLVIALLRGSSLGPVRWAAATYVWLFRAIPTLLQLLFVWNALPQLIPSLRDPWFTPFIAAFVALTLNEAAYMAEIVRSGLASVDRGQILAGKTLGLRGDQIFRLIVLPQMIRVIIPPTGNEFITLLKLTSLASVISLRELLTVTSQTVAVNFRFAELYAAATIWYLVIVSIFMVLQAQLERRFQWQSRERHAPAAPMLARIAGAANR
jgi:His/Glu/Gln/Arg/opine family amino acid ABC transporter permease subunit